MKYEPSAGHGHALVGLRRQLERRARRGAPVEADVPARMIGILQVEERHAGRRRSVVAVGPDSRCRRRMSRHLVAQYTARHQACDDQRGDEQDGGGREPLQVHRARGPRGYRPEHGWPKVGSGRIRSLFLFKCCSDFGAQVFHQLISRSGRSFFAARYTRVLAPAALRPSTVPTSSSGRSR